MPLRTIQFKMKPMRNHLCLRELQHLMKAQWCLVSQPDGEGNVPPGQLFRNLKLTLNHRQKKVIFSYFFMANLQKWMIKIPCPLNRGHQVSLNPFWVNQGHRCEYLLLHYIMPSTVLPLIFILYCGMKLEMQGLPPHS